MDVFDLSASLTLNTEEYEANLSEAERNGRSFGNSIGKSIGKVAVAGFVALTASVVAGASALKKGIKATAEYGDNVDKMSQKIGISAEAYQKWDYVMQRADMNVDSLKMGMKTLSKQAEDNSDSFQKLGISQKEVANLSQEELFERTVKGLSEMEAGTERTALATELLGRAGADMGPLLNQGSEAIEEQMEIAEKYGMVMSDEAVTASAEFSDSITTLQMTMTGLRNRMMEDFLPAVTKVTDGLALLFTGDMSGLELIEEGINEFVGTLSTKLPEIIETVKTIIGNIGTAIKESLPEDVQNVLDDVGSAFNVIYDAVSKVINFIVEHWETISGILLVVGSVVGTLIAISKAMALVTLAQTALNTAMWASPITWIIAGIVGLVTAFIVLWNKSEKFREFWKNLWDKVKNFVISAKDAIVEKVQAIRDKLQAFADKAKEVKDKVVGAFTDIKDKIKEKIDKIKEKIQGVIDKIKEFVDEFPISLGKLFTFKTPKVKMVESKGGKEVSWLTNWEIVNNAEGGIMKRPTLFGLVGGEAGDEAILPLDPFWKKMDKITDSIEGRTVSGTMTSAMASVMVGAVEDTMSELVSELQDGMADALEGVQVKLNGRNFGKLTREAVNGTI